MTETALALHGTYFARMTRTATEMAAKLRTLAAAERKLATLEGQLEAAKNRLGLARERRPRSQQTRSKAEISASAKIQDTEIMIDAVKARIKEF